MVGDVKMEWLMEDEISTDAGLSLARMTVPPHTVSEYHRHPNCAETIHVQSGLIRQRIGKKWYELSEGDTCVVPIGEAHQTQNIGKSDAIMMVCYSSGKRIYERIN